MDVCKNNKITVKNKIGEMSGLTGMSLPKNSYAMEFDSHRGRILLQFIIISNNVMSEYICIKIRLTFI